jgi:hypothetical protein
MLLCDHVAVAEGKLYISGGGWTITGPAPVPTGIAVILGVPWDRANVQIQFTLRLLQEDGQPVLQEGPVGPTPLEIGGQFEVGRPPGVRPGSPLDVPLAINMGPLLLQPNSRFSWELMVDGETHADWHLAFSTRALPTAGEGLQPPVPD